MRTVSRSFRFALAFVRCDDRPADEGARTRSVDFKGFSERADARVRRMGFSIIDIWTNSTVQEDVVYARHTVSTGVFGTPPRLTFQVRLLHNQ